MRRIPFEGLLCRRTSAAQHGCGAVCTIDGNRAGQGSLGLLPKKEMERRGLHAARTDTHIMAPFITLLLLLQVLPELIELFIICIPTLLARMGMAVRYNEWQAEVRGLPAAGKGDLEAAPHTAASVAASSIKDGESLGVPGKGNLDSSDSA